MCILLVLIILKSCCRHLCGIQLFLKFTGCVFSIKSLTFIKLIVIIGMATEDLRLKLEEAQLIEGNNVCADCGHEGRA